MTYATQQDLIDRFGAEELTQLTDRATPPAGAIDATVVARALADADEEINGYLAARYQLPLATTPQVLVRLAADLARYALHDDRATEQVTRRRNDAVAFLRSISKGEVNLGLDPAQQPTPSIRGAESDAPDRLFTRETLSDF